MIKMPLHIGLLLLCLVIGTSTVLGANLLQTNDQSSTERYTLANALTGVQNISDWLKSFRELTELTADRISSAEKQQVGNLGWEIQNLGFYNWVKLMEGTLRKQNYDICKLEYELALERCAAGKINQSNVDEKERKYQEAKEDLQKFLAKVHIAD